MIATMPLLTIHHKTEYRYAHPVAFGEHRIMLRPRDGHDLRVISNKLEIVPEPMSLRWIHDVFGNSVAIATFDERADMPWPGDPRVNRRKAVQRNQHRRDAIAQAPVDHLGDAAMVGIEDLSAPRLRRVARKAFVAGDDDGFADNRDRAWRAGRAVAVDYQSRVTLRDQMRVQMFR